MDERRRILLETVRGALEQDDLTTLRLVLNGQRSADLAALFGLLNEHEQLPSLRALAEPLAAETLADMLGDLPAEQSESVLGLMEAEDAADLRELLTHPEDTGGGIMTSRLLAVSSEDTVAEAVTRLRQ